MRPKSLLIGVVILIAVVMLVSSSYATIDPETIVGMWLFDEGSGKDAKDSSENENHGTFSGAPEWTEGKFDGGLEFGGDDRVVVPSSESIKSTKEGLTLVFWMYPTKEAPFGNVLEVNGNNGWRLRVFDGPEMNFFDRGGTNKLSVKGTPPVDQWSHVAVTGSQDGITIYINGEIVGNKEVPYAPDPGDDNLSIGGCDNYNEYYVGKLDEVGIFNVALSGDDIKRIMNRGLPGTDSAVASLGKLATTWGSIRVEY